MRHYLVVTWLQVVHADMKTKNILLSSGRMTAKIADVGLARYMAQTHMDTKSLPMGTFVYAAPELLLGRRSDHKASFCISPSKGYCVSTMFGSSAGLLWLLTCLCQAGRPCSVSELTWLAGHGLSTSYIGVLKRPMCHAGGHLLSGDHPVGAGHADDAGAWQPAQCEGARGVPG